MALARFHVAPESDGWKVDTDGGLSGPYLTREAAFEALLGPASTAIKQGDEIRIVVEAPPPGKPVG
jgi:hypothetical protein